MNFITKYLKGDKGIWAVVILLFCWSSIVVYSATGSLAWRMDKSEDHYFISHMVKYLIGFGIIFIVSKVNYVKYKKIANILFAISVPLLFFTLFMGTSLNDGSRWISIPIVNITFQTSDLAKLAIFMYLARILSDKQDVIKDFKQGFLKILWPVILICVLIAFANLSTALLLGLTCCILFYMGRVKVGHILLLAGAGLAFMFLVYGVSKATGFGRADTWESRIQTYMGNGDTDDNFQITQAKIAIANGGVVGKGPGNSWARDYLPHPYSDMVFAMIIEEYGIIGAVGLIMVYLVLLWRSIEIFKKIPYAFGAFLVIGLSFTMVFQAFVNMGVTVNLLPVTGLTLPLMSMGGSSIWFNCVAIGIILSVSNYVEKIETETKEHTKTAKQEAVVMEEQVKEFETI